MSKPMVVTLPFVLLLLDFWPFQRCIASGAATFLTFQRLLIEKLPFLALTFASSILTYYIDRHSTTASSFGLVNSLSRYLRYLVKTFAPINLAVLYPLPAHAPIIEAIAAAVILLAITLAFIYCSRRRPYLLVGWFWFLGTLVPVIGLVQAGYQSIADRFTYLPCIGLFIAITWGLADLFQSARARPLLAVAAFASLSACAVLTSIQIQYWRNSITLFRHTLAVTKDNFVACACLGQALDANGDDQAALPYCKEAVRLNPEYAPGQLYLGMVLSNDGDMTNALIHLNKAVQLDPDNLRFRYNLGKILLDHGGTDAAITQFNAAIALDPDFAEAHNALGKAYLKEGNLEHAADQLTRAVTLSPNNANFHYDLGTVLLRRSQSAAAIAQFREAVRLQPDYAVAHENLAVALANEGNMADAINHFSVAAKLQPNDPEAHFNLGFAYLNNHQPDLAAEQFMAELRLTPDESKAHYRLAQALRDQNQVPQAVNEYRQTLKLAPGFDAAKKEMDEILAAHAQLR